ncbi:MAG: DevR family CRISPR-associated autoregulator [Methanosarcinales archaeon]
MANEKIYEISVLGRTIWSLHSLSNEGTVGNVTEPRTIMLADGTKTDGISGEMLKHVHVENMWALETDKNKFCNMCKTLRAERADGNEEVKKKTNAEEAIEEAIKCELCDIHGFLIQRPPATRESTVEFGWAVGIPEIKRDIHVHARHSVQGVTPDEIKEKRNWEGNRCSASDCKTLESESDLFRVGRRWYCQDHIPTAQMIYHRPTRSGVYAIVSVFQPWRIGLNNVNFNYEVDDEERKSRYQLTLRAYQAMFLRTEGAMTTTRLPHTENFEGVIVVSKTNYPAPVISPLRNDYIDQVKKINTALGGNNFEIIEFSSISEFVEKIEGLISRDPYKI